MIVVTNKGSTDFWSQGDRHAPIWKMSRCYENNKNKGFSFVIGGKIIYNGLLGTESS